VSPLLWWVDRAAGLVLLVLLTGALVTGLRSTAPRRVSGVPRFATLALHRNLALLSLCLLAVHVGTAVADSFVDIAWWQVVVPAGTGYRPLWVGLGTVAVDLLLAVVATSALRHRVGLRSWRAVHLLVWPAWLAGVGHALALGTDLHDQTPWAVLPVCACLVAVALAGAARLAALRGAEPGRTEPAEVVR
jgi:DMSO/TMAO reductase YedYZ heme-binding membrane subunit